jgi:hypothetical protein
MDSHFTISARPEPEPEKTPTAPADLTDTERLVLEAFERATERYQSPSMKEVATLVKGKRISEAGVYYTVRSLALKGYVDLGQRYTHRGKRILRGSK